MAIKGKPWRRSETKRLLDNYHHKTIFELMKMFPGRTQEGINNKIKRLRREGRLSGHKEDEAISKAYKQRDENK